MVMNKEQRYNYLRDIMPRMKGLMLAHYAKTGDRFDLDNVKHISTLFYYAVGIFPNEKSAPILQKCLKNSLQHTRWYAFMLVNARQYCKECYDKQQAWVDAKRKRAETKKMNIIKMEADKKRAEIKKLNKKVIDNSESER